MLRYWVSRNVGSRYSSATAPLCNMSMYLLSLSLSLSFDKLAQYLHSLAVSNNNVLFNLISYILQYSNISSWGQLSKNNEDDNDYTEHYEIYWNIVKY